MYTKRNYFDDENLLIGERYFVYQSGSAGGPAAAPKPAAGPEVAPTKPTVTPEKPATLEDAQDKLKIVKDSLEATKAKYPKSAETNAKFKALGTKLEEINKKLQEIEKEADAKKQELIKNVNTELDAIIADVDAPKAPAASAKPAEPVKASEPAKAPDKAPNAPAAKPDKPAKAPGLSESGKTNERALHESVVKEVEEAAKSGKTCSEIIKNVKTALLKIKDKPEFKDLYANFNKQLDDAQAKVTRLKDKGSETVGLPGLREKIATELTGYKGKIDAVLPKAPDKPVVNPDKPDTTPDKPANAPTTTPESKEGVEGAAKRELGKYLDEVAKNPDKFSELRDQINKTVETILSEMKIDLKNVIKTQYVDLPGGYRMSVYKWDQNADKMPNAIIYKGKDLICYKDYGVLRQATPGQAPDAALNAAQIVKSFDQFPKTFRGISAGGKGRDALQITDEAGFFAMGKEIANCSRQDKPWVARLDDCRVSYDPADKLVRIQPMGVTFQIVLSPPKKVGTILEGESKISWINDIKPYIETKDAKAVRLAEEGKKQEAEAEGHFKETVKKKVGERGAQKEADRKVAEDKEKAMESKISGLVRPEYKHLTFLAGSKILVYPTDKVTGNMKINPDKKDLETINRLPIDKLLDLTKVKDEAMYVTISGPGKPERKGVCLPGQNKVYEIKDGKQTKEPVKFYHQDTISFEFKKQEKPAAPASAPSTAPAQPANAPSVPQAGSSAPGSTPSGAPGKAPANEPDAKLKEAAAIREQANALIPQIEGVENRIKELAGNVSRVTDEIKSFGEKLGKIDSDIKALEEKKITAGLFEEPSIILKISALNQERTSILTKQQSLDQQKIQLEGEAKAEAEKAENLKALMKSRFEEADNLAK